VLLEPAGLPAPGFPGLALGIGLMTFDFEPFEDDFGPVGMLGAFLGLFGVFPAIFNYTSLNLIILIL